MKRIVQIIFFLATQSVAAQNHSWVKQIGGLGLDYGVDIITDDDGNTYSIGNFSGTVDFDPGPSEYNLTSNGGEDIYILKLDNDGSFVWAKAFGGVDSERPGALALDDSGNIYSCGDFTGNVDFDPGAGTFEMYGVRKVYLSKLDASGNFVWAKSIGGDHYIYAKSLFIDHHGNVLATGHFESAVDFDPGPDKFMLYTSAGYSAYILKLDKDGNFVWAKAPGGSNYVDGFSICSDADANVYVLGHFSATVDFDPGIEAYELTAAGSKDVFICVLNTDGNFLWANRLGGPGNDSGTSLTLDNDANIYITGNFEGLADFDPGAEDYPLLSSGYRDIFISKLDRTGAFLWAKQVGGSDNDDSNSIAVDPFGNVFVSGTFQALADFDPDELSENTMISKGDLDGFVLKLDSNGEFLGSVQLGGFNVDYLIATVNTIGHVYSTGFFTYTVDFDPMGGTMELQSKGYYDSFVLMMSGDLVLGIEEADEKGVNAFPNPVSTTIKIVVEHKLIGCQFSLFDLRGNKVRSGVIEAATTPVSVDDLRHGIYFIQVLDRVYKIVKQ